MRQPPRDKLLAVARSCSAAQLRRATRAVSHLYDELLAPTGLRGTQFSVLVALSLTGEAPLLRLAEALDLDRTTMTRNLALLERDGLVTSAPGADRRVRLIKLSPLGKRRLAQALPLWEQAQRQVQATLGEDAFRQLQAGLLAVSALAPPGAGDAA